QRSGGTDPDAARRQLALSGPLRTRGAQRCAPAMQPIIGCDSVHTPVGRLASSTRKRGAWLGLALLASRPGGVAPGTRCSPRTRCRPWCYGSISRSHRRKRTGTATGIALLYTCLTVGQHTRAHPPALPGHGTVSAL